MRTRRTSAAGAVAALAALGLVAAAAPAAPVEQVRAGSAGTSLLGAVIEVTNLPVEVPAISVLDAVTFASTDTDVARNAAALPFSQVLVTPLRLGSEAIGQIDVNSNGTGTGTTPLAATGMGSPLGVAVAPITATATASADAANAVVGTALADVTALLGAVGLDLDVSGIASGVDQSGAAALQGLRVGAIDINLADLGLDADLLGTLPLGDLLELLDQLPLELPADVQAIVDGVLGSLGDLDAAVGAIGSLTEGLPVDAAQLAAITDALAAAGPLADLLGQLTSTARIDLVDLTALLGSLSSGDLAVLAGCTDVNLNDPLAVLAATGLVDELADCVAGLLLATNDPGATGVANPASAADLVGLLEGGQADILGELVALAGDGLPGGLDDIVAALQDVLAGVGGLDDLLGQLTDLLPAIADTSVLSVSAFDVGINAIAGATEAESSATLVCSAVDVAVLGQAFAAPSCKDGLDQIGGALALVGDAIDTVTGLLNTLPLADVLQVGDLNLEVFGDLTESVTTENGYVRSVASMELLDLTLPSLSLDPSAVVDSLLGSALDGLGVPDVLGTLGLDELGLPLGDASADSLGGLLGVLEGLDQGIVSGNDSITSVVADVQAAVDGILATDGLLDQLGAITDLLDGLPLGDLGTLVAVTTPGLHLVVDPSSTAEYSVTAAPAPVTPPAPAPLPAPSAAPTPVPAPTPAPALPSTGGGMALLGLLSAGGALALRRRRD